MFLKIGISYWIFNILKYSMGYDCLGNQFVKYVIGNKIKEFQRNKTNGLLNYKNKLNCITAEIK